MIKQMIFHGMTVTMQGIQLAFGGWPVSIDSPQLAALSRLFSTCVFREMARYGQSETFARLYRSSGLGEEGASNYTVADGFDAAFAYLKQAGRRDEYVYRAAVTNKVLLGRHSLNTACMLSEFRAGASKADLVILNGTATAYEIKSERDSLDRLATQVSNYRKVFATVNVIASERHIEGVLDMIPDSVGLLCLTRRYRIRSERDAIYCPESICPVTVLESVRTKEAQQILKQLGVSVPDVPNTQLHSEMRKLFLKQEPSSVHRAMVSTLKHTRNLSALGELVESLPSSLQAAALSIRLKKDEHQRLVNAVSVSLADAMRWG